MSPVFTIAIALVVEVGRRVEFRVTKARVSFPRKESYGLEARFKVNPTPEYGSYRPGSRSTQDPISPVLFFALLISTDTIYMTTTAKEC